MTRCEFCHEYIPHLAYPAHRAAHLNLLADGQQQEYASLPPEARFAGGLEYVPRVYVHLECGGGTVMQESIIRSYLQNPFIYGDGTFCTGCGKHISDRACFWRETGENLHDYMDRLRAAWLSKRWGRLGRLWARIRGFTK